MADGRVSRVVARLQNLPSISLPTDYPRPTSGNRLVEAAITADLSEQTSLGLLKLALFNENQDDEDGQQVQNPPSAFHLLLAAFAVLLHRYTGDQDLVIGSSSAFARDPLVLRLSVDPTDTFWTVVRKVQHVEQEAESDILPYETIVKALRKDKDDQPLFRVRFFDETDQAKENFIRTTSLTSDLTVFVSRGVASTRASLAPLISLRILYNSLLFTQSRISGIVDQLSVFLRKVASKPLAHVSAVSLLTHVQREILPSPTSGLDWCGWKGAITDIFSQNARAFPERPCVIQTSNTQMSHIFSYGTIRCTSNILAHHLLQNGIQREEVVMIYAHRGVELVVAVMAVLKAGATFSVIGQRIELPPSANESESIKTNFRSSLPSFSTNHLSWSCPTTWAHCAQWCRNDQSSG
jgi:L-2-aminoadipate reductase